MTQRSKQELGRFYRGAARIEGWLDKPPVERFMDAASLYYMTFLFIFAVGVLVAVAIGLTVSAL